MIPLTLQEVADAVGGSVVGDGDTLVTGVSTDSRRVVGGDLFVALRGETADGHDHVDDARAAGAAAALVERPVSGPAVVVADTWAAIGALGAAVRRRVDPFVVSVTGSVGKTTTKDLAAAALGTTRRTVAAPGSYNNELGVPLTLLATAADTEALVVEVGARGVGHIAALTPLVAADVAVVTAVAGVHLERFGTLEDVARAKAELVADLDPAATAVLNADDDRVAAMADRTRAAVLRYGVDRPGDLTAVDVRLDDLARPRFTARTPWGEAEVALPVAGVHQVGNALAALAAAGVAGVPLGGAAAALAEAPVSGWRGAVAEVGGVVVLNDAYNANPTSVRAALDTLVALRRRGRTWAVLGVMAEIGPTAGIEHERVGAHAVARGVDRLVVVGSEAAAIARGATDAGAAPDAVATVAAVDAAAEALADVRPGDAVLVKASRVAGLERVADSLAARLVEDPA